MAKRKRLTPANPAFLPDPSQADELLPPRVRPAPPIAGQAAESAAQAALDEVSETLSRARSEGRMVIALPLSQIDTGHLVRDRLPVEDSEMEALVESLRNRGQQSPVEVTPLGKDRYGLISGWRRCLALERVHGDAAEVLALVRHPETSGAAYVAMVEENEIRTGLSFYERARVVVKTVENRVYSSEKEALNALFGHVPRARRSKVKSFISIVRALDTGLRFPQVISERAGLSLAKAIDQDPTLAGRIIARLSKEMPQTAEAEQAVIAACLAGEPAQKQALKGGLESSSSSEIRPGLILKESRGALTLKGPALTDDLRARLLAWLKDQA